MTGSYCPCSFITKCIAGCSTPPGVTIVKPISAMRFALTAARCFRCLSLAAKRILSFFAISSGVRLPASEIPRPPLACPFVVEVAEGLELRSAPALGFGIPSGGWPYIFIICGASSLGGGKTPPTPTPTGTADADAEERDTIDGPPDLSRPDLSRSRFRRCLSLALSRFSSLGEVIALPSSSDDALDLFRGDKAGKCDEDGLMPMGCGTLVPELPSISR